MAVVLSYCRSQAGNSKNIS